MYAAGLYPPSEVEATVGMMRPFDGSPSSGHPLRRRPARLINGFSWAESAICPSWQTYCAKMAGNRFPGTQVNRLPPCGSMG
jgi:hypothetical protein